MSDQKDSFIQIKMPIRTNKNFVYKGKKYPVDFRLIKINSNFFSANRHQYKHIDDIELQIDCCGIKEDSIPTFIACCQNEPFEITESNVFSLLQLSIQYEVPELNRVSTEYINNNENQLLIQSIFFKLNNCQKGRSKIDLHQEEEQISSHFFEYINNDKLLELPIPVLYRIINSPQLNINSMNQTNQSQLIEFLFKCLDRYKRDASVLFLNIDVENERIGLFSRLLNGYSDVFDFNMLSPKFLLKTSSQLLSEVSKLNIEFSSKLNEIQSEFQKHQNLIDTIDPNEYQVMKNKVGLLEQTISEQSKIIDKIKSKKVTAVFIESDHEFLVLNEVITLTARVEPANAFEDGVEWTVNPEDENSIEINGNTLKLKCLVLKKVTVEAKSIDGTEIKAIKEFPLIGSIEISVAQNQIIKGSINLNGFGIVEKSNSKFLLNKDSSKELGANGYEDFLSIDSNPKEFSFIKESGTYYLHALVAYKDGSIKELVSNPVTTSGAVEKNFDYTGNVQSIELKAGDYLLEVWGAQGGSYNTTFFGGYGGYSVGKVNFASNTTVYIVVGGSACSISSGGYNGGGNGGENKLNAYGGGGATHIGLKSGLLTGFSGDFSSQLLIVAGGGGGAVDATRYGNSDYHAFGGCGGGFQGAKGKNNNSKGREGSGGTQNSGGIAGSSWNGTGSFGVGANCPNPSGKNSGAGGGGGFYGGGSGGNSGPGGGGSGYINTAKLTDAIMYGYNVPTSSSLETRTETTTNVSPSAVSCYAKQGNGYAKITPI